MVEKPKYSIIVPAYSEARIIEESLIKIAENIRLDKPRFAVTEMIVVAADSRDDTAGLAEKQAGLFSSFKLIRPGPKVGKGRDVRTGMLAAQGDYILFMDADLATPPGHIKAAFDKLEETNADLLVADRPLSKIHNNLSRRIKSVLSNLLIRLLATPGIQDTQCGFKAFRGEAARNLFQPLETLGWGFDVEILVRARALGYKIVFLRINDWYDPKENSLGLAGESSIHAYARTMLELFKISLKRLWGYYKQ